MLHIMKYGPLLIDSVQLCFPRLVKQGAVRRHNAESGRPTRETKVCSASLERLFVASLVTPERLTLNFLTGASKRSHQARLRRPPRRSKST